VRYLLIVIGCGPRYQEEYHSFLEQKHVSIPLLIDLKSNEEMVRRFFKEKALKPQHFLFLEERFRNAISFSEIDARISATIDLSAVNGVLISTEPKARKAYTLWAVQRKLPVFMDKPISAFSDPTSMDTLLKDYEELLEAKKRCGTNVVVSCERRAHVGYIWIKEYLRCLIQEAQVPMTAIDIHFAEGIWRLPSEYLSVENHPFKHGYGILLHSGYHYVDLLSSFLSLNDILYPQEEKEVVLQLHTTRPSDHIAAAGKSFYTSLLGSEETEKIFSKEYLDQLSLCGETDVMLMGQVRQKGTVLTNFSLKLFGTSLSLRDKNNLQHAERLFGKTRQEYLFLHMGHLCSLSLISTPLRQLRPKEYFLESFDVTVMNSPFLHSREPLITLNREAFSTLFPGISLAHSMGTFARHWQLEEFLQGRDGHSSLESHYKTVQLLHLLYTQIKIDFLRNQAYARNLMEWERATAPRL